MTGATGRDIAVRMKFSADTAQAKSAMGDLQKQAEQTRKAYENASGAGAASGNNKGWIEFGKLAVSAMAAGRAIEALTKGLQIFGDSTKSLATRISQGVDAALGSLPILGSIYTPVKGFLKEGMFGKEIRRLNAATSEAAESSAFASLAPMRDQAAAWERELFMTGRMNRPSKDVSPAMINGQLFGAAMGEGLGTKWGTKWIHDEGALRQALRGKAGASDARQLAAVGFNRDLGESNFSEKLVEANRNAYNAKLKEYQNQAGGGFDEFKLAAIRAELIGKTNDLLAAQINHQKKLEQTRKSAIELAQKDYELAKASTEIQKIKLNLTQQQADKAKSNAMSFGMLGAGERLAVQAALEDAMRPGGFQNLSADRRQLLASTGLTADYASEQARTSIQEDPIYRNVVGRLGQKTAKQLEEEVKKLTQEIEFKIEVDERKLNEAMKNVAETWLGKVVEITNKAVGNAAERIRLELGQQKAVKQLE